MFSILDPEFHNLAAAAKNRLEERFGLKHAEIETQFDRNVSFVPTVQWRKGYVEHLLEISDTPFPKHVASILPELAMSGRPVKLAIGYPAESQLTPRELQDQITKAKKQGLGLVSVNNDGHATIVNTGIQLSIVVPPPMLSEFPKSLRANIEHAYESYIGGDPKQGVQLLGQDIEELTRKLAVKSKAAGNFVFNADPLAPGTALANIAETMVAQGVLANPFVVRLRAFVVERNEASHPTPRSIKTAKIHADSLAANYQAGLRILKEFHAVAREKGYRL